MTIKQIDKQVERYDTLTQEEKEKLAEAMLKNKKARGRVISGALINGHFQMALALTLQNICERHDERRTSKKKSKRKTA